MSIKGSEAVEWMKKTISVSELNATIILNQMVEQSFIASTGGSDWSLFKRKKKHKEFSKSSSYTVTVIVLCN